jgi:phage terminase large subunit-like protein
MVTFTGCDIQQNGNRMNELWANCHVTVTHLSNTPPTSHYPTGRSRTGSTSAPGAMRANPLQTKGKHAFLD